MSATLRARKPKMPTDWWVTSFCDLKCPFCLGPRAGEQDKLNHREGILSALVASSAELVTFCGGEPLVVREIDRYAADLAAAGKRTVLNTNGLLLRKRVDQGLRWTFDSVGISIHGSNQAVHAAMQGRGADLAEVVRAAELVREHPGTGLKLATVVSAVNRQDLPALAALVRRLLPDVWRLYQYSRRGPQNRGQDQHWLSTEEFEAVAAAAAELAAPVPAAPSTEDVGAGCLIIDPDGYVLQPFGTGYVRHGNCTQEPLDDI